MKASPVIAVIDDDASLREAIGSLLASFDIRSERFCSAEELLAAPRLAQFSCFLSDVVMPGSSGFDLMAQLRARGHRQPVILMTAYKANNYTARARELGATCLLTKPFTTEEIMACVGNALDQPGGAEAVSP